MSSEGTRARIRRMQGARTGTGGPLSGFSAAGTPRAWTVWIAACGVVLLASGARADLDALLVATRDGDADRVVALLDEGADPNDADEEGVTALHLAASRGHVAIARELLQRGADPDQPEFDGDTPLVNASVYGHLEIVRLLIDHGASLAVESSEGFTPIQHARRARHSKIVKLLRESAGQSARRRMATALPAGSALPLLKESVASVARVEKRYQPGYQRRIAAVIGINDYDDWPDLVGAKPDAERVAKRLREMGFDEVFELYDREATRTGILNLLGTRLPERVGENDLVVIFFAGHGQTETLDGETRRKRGYIIPVDATLENVFSTAIAMPKLRELTDRLVAKHVYYAMDSCYSGLGFTRGLGLVKPAAKDYISKVTSLRAVQMVTAGGEGEQAIERDGEGVFTRSFLSALEGAADANADGFVTATEIGAYVAPRVTNETGARQSPQSGRLEGEGEIAFDLGGARAPTTR